MRGAAASTMTCCKYIAQPYAFLFYKGSFPVHLMSKKAILNQMMRIAFLLAGKTEAGLSQALRG